MRCPFCDADKDKLQVKDSRTCDNGRSIRRRRECQQCHKRFTTYERIEDPIRLVVVKKDGSRVPWDSKKLLNGLERACYKRPVGIDQLQLLVDEVEEELFKTHDKEVPSALIGEEVTHRLRRLDQVAYVRFASVYREFKTLEELVKESMAVINAQHYDVPGQGRLFIDEKKAAAATLQAKIPAGGESGGTESARNDSAGNQSTRNQSSRNQSTAQERGRVDVTGLGSAGNGSRNGQSGRMRGRRKAAHAAEESQPTKNAEAQDDGGHQVAPAIAS